MSWRDDRSSDCKRLKQRCKHWYKSYIKSFTRGLPERLERGRLGFRRRYLLSPLSSLLSHCHWRWWVSPSQRLALQFLHCEFSDLIWAFLFSMLGLKMAELNWVWLKNQTGSDLTRLGPGPKWIRLTNCTGSGLGTGLGHRWIKFCFEAKRAGWPYQRLSWITVATVAYPFVRCSREKGVSAKHSL